MIFATLAYNALMALVDWRALVAVRRRRTFVAWLGACAAAGMVALVLAFLIGPGRFGPVRLAAYGVFLHGVVVLAGSAVALGRARLKMAVLSAAGAGLIVAGAVDAFFIEPHWLEVSHVRLPAPHVERPVRIVLLTDLQTDVFGDYQREVLRRVMAEKPDLILLGGDYVQADGPAFDRVAGKLRAFLRETEFSAPLGVFAVRGNVERDGWQDLFAGLPVSTIEGTQYYDLEGGLRLTCLAFRRSFLPTTEVPAAEGRFHVVLGHSPNYSLGPVRGDLLLAGHTHGGQVRLPLVGPLATASRVSRRHAAGLSDLGDGRKLLVSRGVGMERGRAPRLRFLCRPELVVIDLVPQHAAE